MAENCNCTDATGYRTLAELRTELFDRLGFVDPMANIATRTLVLLRADIARRLGYAAQVAAGSYPPGMSDLIDGFINEAQQTLFRRLELDKGDVALPARMTVDADVTTLDYMMVFNLALALAKAHYGQQDAKVYFEVVERALSDVLNRRPPNATAICTNFITDAQRQIIRRYPAVRMDRWFSWSLVAGERFYDFDDDDGGHVAVPTLTEFTGDFNLTGGILVKGTTWTFRLTYTNANGETTGSEILSVFIDSDQVASTHSISLAWTLPEVDECLPPITSASVYVLSPDDGVTWVLQRTQTIDDLTYTYTGSVGPVGLSPYTAIPSTNTTGNPTTTAKVIDTLAIKWVGATNGTEWYPLREGIPPFVLGRTQTGLPQYYNLRQCLEIWPAPAESTGTIQVRAGFNAVRFTADADLPSIDDELVFLYALSNAKAHFKQPDAQLIRQEFETHLMGVVAGSHAANRYVPGRRSAGVYVEPVPTVPFT